GAGWCLFVFKQKTAYELGQCLEFRRVLFGSIPRSAVGYVSSGVNGPHILFEPADHGPASGLIVYDEARGAARMRRVDAARARNRSEERRVGKEGRGGGGGGRG